MLALSGQIPLWWPLSCTLLLHSLGSSGGSGLLRCWLLWIVRWVQPLGRSLVPGGTLEPPMTWNGIRRCSSTCRLLLDRTWSTAPRGYSGTQPNVGLLLPKRSTLCMRLYAHNGYAVVTRDGTRGCSSALLLLPFTPRKLYRLEGSLSRKIRHSTLDLEHSGRCAMAAH